MNVSSRPPPVGCPVCGSSATEALAAYPNLLGRIAQADELVLTGCPNCGVAWSAPLPSGGEVAAFYEQAGGWDDRPGLAAQRAGGEEVEARTRRKLEAKRAIYAHESDLLLGELPGEPGAVLDVGCGLGAWLDVLAARGWRTSGVEPNPTARATAAERHRIVDAPPASGEFDLVILQHVLEHVRDPLATMRDAAAALAPGGHVFVSVPDLGRLAEHAKFSYAASGVHLFSYTLDGLRSLMALAGLELVRHLNDPAWNRDEARRGRHLKALGCRVDGEVVLPADPLASARSALAAFVAEHPDLGLPREPTFTDKLRDLLTGGWRRRRHRHRRP